VSVAVSKQFIALGVSWMKFGLHNYAVLIKFLELLEIFSDVAVSHTFMFISLIIDSKEAWHVGRLALSIIIFNK
jgi:hypothetical protein